MHFLEWGALGYSRKVTPHQPTSFFHTLDPYRSVNSLGPKIYPIAPILSFFGLEIQAWGLVSQIRRIVFLSGDPLRIDGKVMPRINATSSLRTFNPMVPHLSVNPTHGSQNQLLINKIAWLGGSSILDPSLKIGFWNVGVVYTMEHEVVPRPYKICDWMLSLSPKHFGLHQGKNLSELLWSLRSPNDIF